MKTEYSLSPVRLYNYFQIFIISASFLTAEFSIAAEGHPRAMATLSSRSAKPHDKLELLVTVRSASSIVVLLPSNLEGLRIKPLLKPCLLTVDGEKVWLFRYQVIPRLLGNYEIPPITIVDGSSSTVTKPLCLHVSEKGELPPLSARELSLGVNIPPALSEEVLRAAPQPTLKPTPSPTPRDTRRWNEKASSWLGNALKAAWNYPGK